MSYPGMQFPAEAYPQFMKQGVPRWVTTDDEIIKAYIELVDKICPCVVLVHSQSGTFGYKVLEARPDKVKALVAVEPTLGGDKKQGRLGEGHADPGDDRRQRQGASALEEHPAEQRRITREAFKAAGGSLDLVDLPDAGIKGNSHMMMMDKNSDQVAELIQKWLGQQGLERLNSVSRRSAA